MEPSWTITATFWVSVVVSLIALCAVFVSYIVYRSQVDPEIIVYAEVDEKRTSIINLVIKNIGKAAARDVTFTPSSDVPSKAFGLGVVIAEAAEIMTEGPLVRGIPFLPPGGTRIITWGQYGGLLTALGEGHILVTAKYKSHHFGISWLIKHKTTCPLEIVSFEATDASDKNYDKQIADNIEKLTKTVQKAANEMSRRANT